MATLQFRYGPGGPQLNTAEPAYNTNDKHLYIGDKEGEPINIKIANSEDIPASPFGEVREIIFNMPSATGESTFSQSVITSDYSDWFILTAYVGDYTDGRSYMIPFVDPNRATNNVGIIWHNDGTLHVRVGTSWSGYKCHVFMAHRD